MGSCCRYYTIFSFPVCSVVNLPLLQSFSMHLSGIGFETFMLLTLVHGVNFEIIPTSTSDIIGPQEFIFGYTFFVLFISPLYCHCCLFFWVQLVSKWVFWVQNGFCSEFPGDCHDICGGTCTPKLNVPFSLISRHLSSTRGLSMNSFICS